MGRVGWWRALARSLVLLALPVAACRLEMEVELPISAIERAATDNTVELWIRTEMRVPIPSETDCAEYTGWIERALRRRLVEFETWGCGREGVRSYVDTVFKIPMRFLDFEEFDRTRKMSMHRDTILTFAASQPTDEPRRTALALFLRRDELEKLKSEVGGFWASTVTLEDASLTIAWLNDGKEPRKFRVVGAFVDDAPAPNREDFDLPWDAVTKLRLSNVATSSLVEYGLTPVVSILHPDATKPSLWARLQDWFRSLDFGRWWPWR